MRPIVGLSLRAASLALLPMPLLAQTVPASDNAPTGNLRAERQRTITAVLQTDQPQDVANIRANCAEGLQPDSVATRRRAGLVELPDAADYCVAALTRLGRDRSLTFLGNAQGGVPTPALAFDTGFVTAFGRREAVAPSLPAMAAVKSIAERCLARREANTQLCFSAGYVYGVRAANGEVVTVQ